jgi:formate hydrogenlyase subunit 3/multisubunit Na+/H+ antiporter MnhD subunit
MVQSLFLVPVLLSFFILVIPSRIRFTYVLALVSFIVVLSTIPASLVLFRHGAEIKWNLTGIPIGSLAVTIDGISAFFILVMNFGMVMGILYSRGYLEPYARTKSAAQLALHYFSYTWLYLSMLGVVVFRDGLPFLVAWELMAVSSFMLILFEAEKRETLKTAVNYLVQMHIGLVLLIIAFLIAERDSGQFGFDGLYMYFSRHPNAPLFFLFFAGFAFKAGFIPFHTWLPEAHPAAPSHVSGVMSGVMIKMGIYGIVRVLTDVQSDLILIGWLILGISAISGLLGVLMAIVQHDLKKLLAYHSIENIGIIGMGLGLGTIGLGLHNPVIALLGFSGGLLHVLNHSLFKALLFYCVGSVYKSYHTRNIEQLGGVIHKMPVTAGLFLTGALAICGLPPLNGFISEFLIYFGLFNGLEAGSVYMSISLLLAIISLVLIGGLAVFCFTKAFGIVFLGSPRKEIQHAVSEVEPGMRLPQYLIAGLMAAIGLLPMAFLNPLFNLVTENFRLPFIPELGSMAIILTKISLMSLVLIIFISLLLIIRKYILDQRKTETGPTWGCGYTTGTSRQQYTGTSYANNLAELAQPVLQSGVDFKPIREDEIFPAKRGFSLHPADLFRTGTNKIIDYFMLALKKIARLQTGNIQHYILYAFVFILIIFLLLYLQIL